MGLLDDLRKQTDNLKAQEQQQQQRQHELKQYYRTELQPIMMQLYAILGELADHLNYIKPDILVPYQLNAEGIKAKLKQQDYKVQVDSTNDTKLITFRFQCVNPKDIEFVAGDKYSIDKNIEYLQCHNLQYHCRRNNNDKMEVTSANFSIKAIVPITFVFQGDEENSAVNFITTNFDTLGSSRHVFKEHHFNDKFFDELGRYILRENPDFLKLKISDNAIEQIRAQIAEENHKRQQELEQAEEQAQQENVHQLEAQRFRWFKKQNS